MSRSVTSPASLLARNGPEQRETWTGPDESFKSIESMSDADIGPTQLLSDMHPAWANARRAEYGSRAGQRAVEVCYVERAPERRR